MKKAHNQASDWFDELYKKNQDSHESIPWARLEANPLLLAYLEKPKTDKGKALVIGCGLGDDAKALVDAGYEVVAIDVSQVALDEAKKRFSDSGISFEKQDIFDMPIHYHESFDFVFEALTIQSLPVEFREKMIQAISDTLAPEGKLLVVAHQREHAFDGPPWPLTKQEIDLFKTSGLKEQYFEVLKEPSGISNSRFHALYTK